MKNTIRFNLDDPEELIKMKKILNIDSIYCALNEISMLFRKRRKYEDKDPATITEEEFFNILGDRNINLLEE